jgi:hypothetical protein
MKFIILSYSPGLFGEFTAEQLTKGSNQFFNTDPTTILEDKNRFLYPNYLSPINFSAKTYRNTSWPISPSNLETLEKIYKDKKVCIPTHWFCRDVNLTNLPAVGVRLYTGLRNISNLAYAMYWIKSHINSTFWESRKEEIKNLIDKNHPHSVHLQKMLGASNNLNWEFLSYKNNILKNGKPDLDYYIEDRYEHHLVWTSIDFNKPINWFMFDIGRAIHGDHANMHELENFLGAKLNLQEIEIYRDKNLQLVKDKSGIEFEDFNTDVWLIKLKEFIHKNINREK